MWRATSATSVPLANELRLAAFGHDIQECSVVALFNDERVRVLRATFLQLFQTGGESIHQRVILDLHVDMVVRGDARILLDRLDVIAQAIRSDESGRKNGAPEQSSRVLPPFVEHRKDQG